MAATRARRRRHVRETQRPENGPTNKNATTYPLRLLRALAFWTFLRSLLSTAADVLLRQILVELHFAVRRNLEVDLPNWHDPKLLRGRFREGESADMR